MGFCSTKIVAKFIYQRNPFLISQIGGIYLFVIPKTNEGLEIFNAQHVFSKFISG